MPLSRGKVLFGDSILLALLFSKNVYRASLSTYYTFYLIHKFGLGVQAAQIFLFVFLTSVAVGTLAGGPIGDRIGRNRGDLVLDPWRVPLHAGAALCRPDLDRRIGDHRPDHGLGLLGDPRLRAGSGAGQVGMIAGLFFGFSFGLGGLGAAALGAIADMTSIDTVYRICSFLPLLGLLTAFLPNIDKKPAR